MTLLYALFALYTLVMLGRYGPRALVYLAPRTIRISGDAQSPPHSTGQVAAGELLEPLGFRRLGIRRETSPLRGVDVEVDAWVHEDGTCADAYPVGGRRVAVTFLSAMEDGYHVATSNFRRLAAESGKGRVSGVAGASPEGALADHRAAVQRASASHGAPRPVADLGARLELARRYYAGIGAKELRGPAWKNVANALLALVLFVWSVRLLLRGLGFPG